jgi:hypothetical protein
MLDTGSNYARGYKIKLFRHFNNVVETDRKLSLLELD